MPLAILAIVLTFIVFMVLAYFYADGIGEFIYNIITYLKGEDKNE